MSYDRGSQTLRRDSKLGQEDFLMGCVAEVKHKNWLKAVQNLADWVTSLEWACPSTYVESSACIPSRVTWNNTTDSHKWWIYNCNFLCNFNLVLAFSRLLFIKIFINQANSADEYFSVICTCKYISVHRTINKIHDFLSSWHFKIRINSLVLKAVT
jgi:hypothetical protein